MVHLLRSIIIPGPLPHLISRCVSSCIPDTSRETPLPHLTLSTRIRNSGQSFSSLLPFVGCTSSYLWHVGSSSLTRDRILGPLHWEHRVLAPGPRRKSHHSYFSLPVSDTVSLLSPKANIMVSCQTTVSHPAQHKIIQLLRLHPRKGSAVFIHPRPGSCSLLDTPHLVSPPGTRTGWLQSQEYLTTSPSPVDTGDHLSTTSWVLCLR